MIKELRFAEKLAIKMQAKNARCITNDVKDFDFLMRKFLTKKQIEFFTKFKTVGQDNKINEAFQEYNAHKNLQYILPRFVQCKTLSPLDFFFIAKAIDGISDKNKLSILDKSWKFHAQKNGFNFFQLANSLAGKKPKSIWRKLWECIKEEFQF